MITLFGGLIEIESEEKLFDLINNVDQELSIKIVESAIKDCQDNGMFSLEESFIVFIMLNKLKNQNG